MSPPSPPSVVRPEKPPPSFKYVQRLREMRVGGGDKNGDSRCAAAYLQPPVIVEAGGEHHYSIILLHGLGNRGSDFLPILHSFSRLGIDVSNVRFVFPNAPRRTMQWPVWGPSRGVQAWYTYFSDESGKSSADADEIATSELNASAAALLALAEAEARLAEIRRDSPPSWIAAALGGDFGRVFVGGYSQGGTVAAHAAVSDGAPRLAGALLTRSEPEGRTPFFAFRSGRDNTYPIGVQRHSPSLRWSLAVSESSVNHATWSWGEYDYVAASAAFALGLRADPPPTGIGPGRSCWTAPCLDLHGVLVSLWYRFPYQCVGLSPCCRGGDQAPAASRGGVVGPIGA
ncbi:hypothetical protein EMIHUDRAFT_243698 [Emiliania huxleyi CCMP1516]|uniref:Phospholipase/carboxylesterase/thioesterase domain-containing protein n=4 Tax=Emiliania huxleyi TaxID=2903 RepID=A0A0D3J506_EMIH1|nr:hypothetical protein EMIHUDRAFT_243698 [Emiliania huxleyi CCMP1516]EOD18591.1 hypothetical protein EMIHUDRAFT_243698 [Emiliania huxleyi CCMP1516]|eukprot:XP_005771020.1 hypothetical protein EMIHUDRAFT_243698 [Emiliania huxleyi CCMP1516]